jgi:DnaK suppressor protein
MDHRLTDTQRDVLRVRVRQERDRAAARAAALTRDFDDIVTASADAVRDDEHDPEGATIAFERAQVSALLADATAPLRNLEAAERRLADPGVGRCERCGGPIAFERLLARPTATRCVTCAS